MEENTKQQSNITVSRALGCVVPLLVCSLFIAAAIISVANDMYAFVKPAGEVTVSVDSELDTASLSKLLAKSGVVKNPTVFRLYMLSKGYGDDVPYLRGQWTLNTNMSYRNIVFEIFK